MKTIKIIIFALLAVVLSSNSYAQMHDHSKMAASKTEKLKVFGNCESCKARIEKAAKLDGVLKAEWDIPNKILVVTYDPSKTNLDQISKKIASVGHDNEKVKADENAYSALPGCCKYGRRNE